MLFAFTGSWHCGVMCGPIACGLSRERSLFFYHIGRFVSYVGGGILFGYLGQTLFQVQSLGAKILVAVLLCSFFIIPILSTQFTEKFVHSLIYKVLRLNKGLFVFGFLSAFFPCGWLWTFYAGASASGSPWAGAIVTAILWLSTLPALSVFPLFFKKSLKESYGTRVRIAHKLLCFAGIYSVFSHLFL